MNSESNFITEKIKKICFQYFPISVFFYITLATYIPRNCYKFVKTESLGDNAKFEIKKFEKLTKIRLRKKLLIDLKAHATSQNWNKKNVTKIILNAEGKIIGYKLYHLFYPNYFTKTQNSKIVSKAKILKPSVRYLLVNFMYNQEITF
jgi:hypothetical protein